MFANVVFFTALAAAVITVIRTAENRRDYERAIKDALFGCVCVVAILALIPMSKKGVTAAAVLSALFYGIDALSGADVSKTLGVELNGFLFYAYYALLYSAMLIAPFLTAGVIASMLGDILSELRYRCCTKKKKHFFSCLNIKTLALAKAVYENDKTCLIVFLNTQKTKIESELRYGAVKLGAILINKSETDIAIHKNDEAAFYEVCDDKNRNTEKALNLIKKYGDRNKTTDITVYDSGELTERLLDSAEKGNVKIKLIDECKYICYRLLDDYPLYETIKDGEITVLIVGAGKTATELIKALTFCGQYPDVCLKITVLDSEAEKVKQSLFFSCPGLNDPKYDINFISAPALSDTAADLISANCPLAGYIIVAAGSDDENAEIALNLMRLYKRKGLNPMLFVKIGSAVKKQQLDELRLKDLNCPIAFGDEISSYSLDMTGLHVLDKAAINTHYAYYGCLDGTTEEKKEAQKAYYKSEYNQRSSYAFALHIKYKMRAVGANTPEEYTEKIKDEAVLEKLSELEHRRWEAFTRTEGYLEPSECELKDYFSTARRPPHINREAKLHPCLTEWSKLDKLSETVNALRKQNDLSPDVDFKQIDKQILFCLADIIKKASE